MRFVGDCFFIFVLSLSAAVTATTKTTKGRRSSSSVDAIQIEFLQKIEFSGSETFEKTQVGGLSGVVWDSAQNILWTVSDDRGRVNEPRIYGFALSGFEPQTKANGKGEANKAKTPVLELKLTKLIYLKDPKADPKKKSMILDLEGIALLPWGNFLVVNEGDMNQKPRVASRLMEFKTTGAYVRDYDLPADYAPPATGRQTRGPRNNFSFEGLAAANDRMVWVLGLEQGLLQDKNGQRTRLLEYTQPEAWVLKPAREWFYPLGMKSESFKDGMANSLNDALAAALESAPPTSGSVPSELKVNAKTAGKLPTDPLLKTADPQTVQRNPPSSTVATEKNESEPFLTGLADLIHVVGDEWWVLERGVSFGLQGMRFHTDVFSVELRSSQELSKQKIFSLADIDPQLSRNFEGMTWGPDLPDGRKLLILLSDNNLQNQEPSVFAFFAVKFPPPEDP